MCQYGLLTAVIEATLLYKVDGSGSAIGRTKQ
jgi:hypothetical protein